MKIQFAGKFVADLETGELHRSGRRRRLQDKPFRLLELLLARPRRLASYNAIERYLWPDVTVDARHGIKEAAQKLRRALGGDARFLECLRGRGYRLMTDTTAPGGSEASQSPDASERYTGTLAEISRPWT